MHSYANYDLFYPKITPLNTHNKTTTTIIKTVQGAFPRNYISEKRKEKKRISKENKTLNRR